MYSHHCTLLSRRWYGTLATVLMYATVLLYSSVLLYNTALLYATARCQLQQRTALP